MAGCRQYGGGSFRVRSDHADGAESVDVYTTVVGISSNVEVRGDILIYLSHSVFRRISSMAAGLSLGLNLISIVLFLLPGLMGVKLGLLKAERADWFNRVDTIALSFAVSLASLLSVYALHSLYRGNPLSTDELASVWLTLPWGIFVYLLLVLISLSIGVILAFGNFGGDAVARRSGLWNKFFVMIDSESTSEEYQVRVHMESGDEIWGRVEEKGEIGANRDIVLEDPLRIIRGEDGAIGEKYRYTGYAYLHNQDISHVEFDSLRDADDFQKSGEDGSEPEPDDETEELEEFADEGPDGMDPDSDG